jgi:hypothetical protein
VVALLSRRLQPRAIAAANTLFTEAAMRPSRIPLLLAATGCLLAGLLVSGADDPAPANKSVKDLQKERVAVLAERLAMAQKAAKLGAGVLGEADYWEYRLAVAKAELDGKTDELRKLYELRLAAIKAAEAAAEKAHKAGAGSVAEILEAREARLEVEIALARLKKD